MTGGETAIIILVLFGLWCGYRVGRVRGRTEERLRKPDPVTPTCPCGHTVGAHKDLGRCLAQVRRPHYTSLGDRNGHEYVICPCTKYYGPAVVGDEFFHPGMVVRG